MNLLAASNRTVHIHVDQELSEDQYWLVRHCRNEMRDDFFKVHDRPRLLHLRQAIRDLDKVLTRFETAYPPVRNQLPDHYLPAGSVTVELSWS